MKKVNSIIDRALVHGDRWGHWNDSSHPSPMLNRDALRGLQERISISPVFDISNVAEYFWGSGDYKTWQNTKTFFPNIAPPFPCFSMVYPRQVRVCGGFRNYAVVFCCKTQEEMAEFGRPDIAEGVKWVLFLYVIAERRANEFFIMDSPEMHPVSAGGLLGEYLYAIESPDDNYGIIRGGIISPCFLALSIAHCKNASTREVKGPAMGERLLALQEGRGNVSYHVLEIKSMVKTINDTMDEYGVSMPQALHICRGHFKDYREKGLFGREKGVFWWDSHVRGDRKVGVSEKDYSVVNAG